MIRRPCWYAAAFAAIALAGVFGPVASAATHPCAAVAEDAQRLACYDSAFERPAPPAAATSAQAAPSSPVQVVQEAPAAAQVVAAPPAVIAPPVQAAVPAPAVAPAAVPVQPATPAAADFGLTEHAKRSLEPDSARRKPASITAGVTAVARGHDTRFVVTLDNGQVWRQVETLSQARISVGDSVTIREAALGSFLLVTANRIATRVRRVR